LQCNLCVGLMASLQIEYQEQNFPLDSPKNGRIGTLLFLQLYYTSEMFMCFKTSNNVIEHSKNLYK
jgi:hypothetical protein